MLSNVNKLICIIKASNCGQHFKHSRTWRSQVAERPASKARSNFPQPAPQLAGQARGRAPQRTLASEERSGYALLCEVTCQCHYILLEILSNDFI